MTCGASSPAPQPRSTSTAPTRGGGGTSAARAAASQCSIANGPRGRHQCSASSSYWAGSFLTRPCRASVTRSGCQNLRMRALAATPLALLRACHPEPTAAVTLMMTALAVTAGRDARGVLMVAAAVLTGQLSIGWLNDVLDARRDRAVGRLDKPVA